ncbi:MAG TPA: hypothetical protein VEA59_05290 [Patescibacteria group bacterium]|nr:hypothetical protein [Patescibacteria group bacterium]
MLNKLSIIFCGVILGFSLTSTVKAASPGITIEWELKDGTVYRIKNGNFGNTGSCGQQRLSMVPGMI